MVWHSHRPSANPNRTLAPGHSAGASGRCDGRSASGEVPSEACLVAHLVRLLCSPSPSCSSSRSSRRSSPPSSSSAARCPRSRARCTCPGWAPRSRSRATRGASRRSRRPPSDDLFRAQGYVAAQDRFFEMDYRRHVTAGPALGARRRERRTRSRRTRSSGRSAGGGSPSRSGSCCEPATQARAAGVRGRRERLPRRQGPGAIAVEYTSARPAGRQSGTRRSGTRSTRSPGSRRWPGTCAATTTTSWPARARSPRCGDVARVDELFPAYPQDLNAPILTAADLPPHRDQDAAATTPLDLGDAGPPARAGDGDRGARGRAAPARRRARASAPTRGSSAGELTESGKPLLANDPHLGISAPGVWEQVGLRCAEVVDRVPLRRVGLLVRGHARRRHRPQRRPRLGPDQPGRGRHATSSSRGSTGARRGATAAPRRSRSAPRSSRSTAATDVRLTVRETVHGPIVSDVLDLDAVGDAPRARRTRRAAGSRSRSAWTALQPGRTMDARARDGRRDERRRHPAAAAACSTCRRRTSSSRRRTATSATRRRAASRSARDVAGGPVPSDGTWPRPGWDSAYDWQGYVDPDDMPRALDPADGFIVTANQAVTPDGIGPFLTDDWDYGYRAQRIRDLIDAATAERQGRRRGHERHPARPAQPVRRRPRPGAARAAHRRRRSTTTVRTCCARGTACSPRTRRRRRTSPPCGRRAALGVRRRPARRRTAPTAARAGSRWSARLLDEPDVAVVGRQDDARRRRGSRRGADPRDGRGAPAAHRAAGPRRDASGAGGRLHTAAPEHPVLGGSSIPGLVRSLVNPDPLGGGRRLVDRRRDRVGRELRVVRGHGGAVDAHGRRPRRPRLVDVGDPHGLVGPPGERRTTPTSSARGRAARRSRGRSRRRRPRRTPATG